MIFVRWHFFLFVSVFHVRYFKCLMIFECRFMCKNGASQTVRYDFFGSTKSISIINLVSSFKKFKILEFPSRLSGNKPDSSPWGYGFDGGLAQRAREAALL